MYANMCVDPSKGECGQIVGLRAQRICVLVVRM